MVRHNPERAFGDTEIPEHGINRRPLKYLVFAGNYRQFNLWQTQCDIPPGEALFVSSPTNLLQVKGEFLMVKVGTFHLRPDSLEIMKAARERFPNAKWQEYTIH